MKEYDFIIIGAGAAGLMLADGMGKDPAFSNKTILLIDKTEKRINDRTWCYWEAGNGPFDAILHKKWEHIYFAGKEFCNSFNIAPYAYKMVRGIDFYQEYLERIRGYSNLTFTTESVVKVEEQNDDRILVETNRQKYRTRQAFSSWLPLQDIEKNSKYPILQQHFIGWFVRTKKPVFKPQQATFMDFSLEQKGNTRFMYVLPFTETEALIEYTLFSPDLLKDHEYEEAIKAYMINEFNCSEYEITEKEKGSIPMSCYDFTQHNTPHLYHIGTAGGWSKPSTGYTFRNTAKKTRSLVEFLKTGQSLSQFYRKNRFWYYDLLLLNILYRNNELGHQIFESLFAKRNPQLIFKFLDEETKWYEDIYIMMAPNPLPFIKSLCRHLFWALTRRKKQW
jgi:lycopene beta-cyclase